MTDQDSQKAKPANFVTIALVLGILALGGIVLFQNFFNQQPTQTGLVALPEQQIGPESTLTSQTSSIQNIPLESEVIDPTQFPVREEYFKEVFRIKRDTYHLFEKAAVFLKRDVSEIPAYFSLKNEEEIFASLPEPAADFSEIAYLFAAGKYYTIGQLGQEYFKQPELYGNFKNLGLRYFTKPDPSSWVTNGYGTYPSVQYDTLVKGKREEFDAVVFFHTAWGVQTFQGLTVSPTQETQKYFDVEISLDDGEKVVKERSFLLEPVFPRFYKNWVYKVVVKGKLKPEVAPGTYQANFNVEIPPKDYQEKWEFEHKNLYMNAAAAIAPSGYPIQFNITVK